MRRSRLIFVRMNLCRKYQKLNRLCRVQSSVRRISYLDNFRRFQSTSRFYDNDEAYRAAAITLPDISFLKKLNTDWKLLLNDEELEELRTCMMNAAQSYQKVSDLIAEKHENGKLGDRESSKAINFFQPKDGKLMHPRTTGVRVRDEENELGGWYYYCDIQAPDLKGKVNSTIEIEGGNAEGKGPKGVLDGLNFVIKDSIAVGGVPMMNGSRML